ncbi:MAG TPA: YkgJ family cysteine cluster protein [Gammaproteobacteria bacterium]
MDRAHEQPPLPAGDFSNWLLQARNALLGDSGMEVACGDCIGCCSSSYFIHIQPQETQAIGLIRKELLFPAPGMPKDHLLMGYDRHGLCPMLDKGSCTIYAHRPQTCRNYDCRIFSAAGIAAGDAKKSIINQRVARWSFSYPSTLDRQQHLAVQAAAKFIRDHADSFPDGRVPDNPSQLAILALKVYEVFLTRDGVVTPAGDSAANLAIAQAIVAASRAFDAQMPALIRAPNRQTS